MIPTPEPPARTSRGLDLLFIAALAGIVALGLWLRLEELTVKPLHHDESVNGWFTLRLHWWNVYKYRPADYHGPLLYYINLFFFRVLGPNETALRLGTVLAGSCLPIATVLLRPQLGRVGVVIAGALLAVSPGLVYFSRTNIHETYLVLFTVVWVGLLARYMVRPSRALGVLAAATCALSFATKETTLITGACLIAGYALAGAWGTAEPRDLLGGRSLREAAKAIAFEDRVTWRWGWGVFAVILVVLFSSFFTYGYGIGGFFQAFAEWFKHGVGGRNQAKSWDYFAAVLEWTLLWLPFAAIPGALLALAARRRFGLFLVGWTVTTAIVYSLIPYKTPWCGLNIDLPLILLVAWSAHEAAGVVADASVPWLGRALAVLAVPVPLAAIPAMVEQVHEVNTERYDDDDVPYVFVQSQREVYRCVDYLLDVERSRPDREDAQGPAVVNLGAKNPIRWYTLTRGWDHHRTTYAVDEVTEEQVAAADVVIATSKDHDLVEAVVEADGEWHLERCRLRPGHRVSVWWRAAHWAAFLEDGGDSDERDARTFPARRGPPPPEPVFTPARPAE